ncbi:hypothetical protein [Antarcticirhabdus aurantiaca]|uniref:Uncharacterized protein n=1 Tax=Antarcticirhabdus aurantiaca TaxID=2606717 RepID=A0ACD4NR74_9HYPH|nr:hypothetical protein OXU80_03525 [Jeongeuplla avenae]
MSLAYDLLGDPIPEGRGKRGRPEHIPTIANRTLVVQLLAFGWEDGRIANALGVSRPTLRKHYRRELKVREAARDRVDANRIAMLWEQSRAGNVAAMKEYGRLIEKNDVDEAARSFERQAEAGERQRGLGKKEVAQLEATTAGEGTEWADDLTFDQPRLN